MEHMNVAEFLGDLDAGVFEQKLSRALMEAAAGCLHHGDNGKKGKVMITFDIARMSNGTQVDIVHKITSTVPTRRGKVTEEDSTGTPMYVGPGGAMTFFPPNQEQLFTKTGEVKTNEKGE